jgi:SPP1 gp7 family putative phage head morphogenesis protein
MTVLTSENYWNVVFDELMAECEENGKAKYLLIEKKYRQAIERIEERIRFFYGKYATNNKVSLKNAYRKLDKEHLETFHDLIEQYIKYWDNQKVSEKDITDDTTESDVSSLSDTSDWVETLKSYQNKSDVTQYECLLIPIIQEVEEVSNETSNALLALLVLTGWTVHHDITKNLKIQSLTQEQLKKELLKAWSADNMSLYERFNVNKAKLTTSVKSTLIKSFRNEATVDEVITEVSKLMGISENAAKRLVVTENTHFTNYATYLAMSKAGYTQYQYFSRLTANTCETCMALHGSIFPLEAYEEGVTAPSMHPYCVCYVKPVLGLEVIK